MMVDPMFMIVKNLRLLLTAVTPTAGAPTAVILCNKVKEMMIPVHLYNCVLFYFYKSKLLTCVFCVLLWNSGSNGNGPILLVNMGS